ncbi:MAG: DUF4159 domain-containing protein [Ignavibacteria bacterium]|nr:DUF4159 domain-containing protein [Ignavibacteria bacterium]MBK7159636.1 DUF4159 domain-containing protein [Ignavibacteria bacterium]MBK7445163.1 DUF4159 domain-containing protein [Ignavibacteria bacterium]MBK8383295.1 DUF4159 domain-containing protein [Ignavibacteria bacterium]MBK9403118.1 DUF4159 domain-containing protein [Ignavibacteria bacterium]
MKITFYIITLLLCSEIALSQSDGINKNSSPFKIARLKYSGGGDWYNDPSAEINMMDYLKKNTTIDVDEPAFYSVDISSDDIFNYPFLLITGHGNIEFSQNDVVRLRKYCESGGFLYADDDYGMNESFRREIKKVFPGEDLKELPFDHKIYKSQYTFPNGLPKIHEHDAKPPQGFGIYINNRLCVYYTYETNISDGWADTKEHQDPPEKKEEAFKMGTNIIVYALMN